MITARRAESGGARIEDAKVKKAITALGLKPAAKKGVCNYYEKSAIPKIKKALA